MKTKIIGTVILWIMAYLICSLVSWNLNIVHWHVIMRFIYGVMAILILIITAGGIKTK